MIGPKVKEAHPRSLLKRRLPPVQLPEVEDVCSYETISELLGSDDQGGGSPASLESGYQTGGGAQDDEDSNLSWLLNFKVSSLFDPAEDSSPPRREDACMCIAQRSPTGKPPFTYTELIERALKEQGELTVSGIYNWISTKFPYYNPSDDRWKNSVRHNLSINPHFRKGLKSRQGAGHLWTLSNEGVNPPPESWKRCRVRSPSPEAVDEAALAAATIMQVESEPEDPSTPALHRVAEEILSGVKRRVEVQYLVHDQNSNGIMSFGACSMPDHAIVLTVPTASRWSTTSHCPLHQPNTFWSNSCQSCHSLHPRSPEFLNPVSKEEIVSESGLEANHCEATSSLLSEFNNELHLPDNLFSDELTFTCYSQL